MSRSARLLDLIQILRRHRRPVSGESLARELGISIRTLYRDIATLQAQGAGITGEPGVGYVLQPGFMLPPLMFTEDELEALVLGSRWVSKRAGGPLGQAAENALAKIAAVLPKDLREQLDTTNLLAGPGERQQRPEADLTVIRLAIRREHILKIAYEDAAGHATARSIWPFALGFFDKARVISAWCELRQDYRHFRTDRILNLEETGKRYPRRRQVMMKEWWERLKARTDAD
ncbi:helix-turn-helix transcriptional regulator [Pannonibacter phragmitetus]|uniref:helix-turn-helix transcriptional regulator n=1 Tax=Pannonibacter phragmitetus TaxID=121719 RepID=UPI003D2F40F1